MKVWTLFIRTEDSDEYGPYVFEKKPTKKQLEKFLREVCSNEVETAESDGDPWDFYLTKIMGPTETETMKP